MFAAKNFFAVVLVCLLVGMVAWGQASTSQISGIVTDPSGSSIPGADVKATQTDTGLVRTTTSGADGAYVLTNLPVGPWTLEFRKEGFNKYVQSGIVLQVNTNPTIDAALKVGSVSEQVTVEAGAALVETHSTGIGTVVDNQRVVELPLNGRDPVQLIFLSGMATPATIPQLRNFPSNANVSIAGGQGNGVNYLLDGALHNDFSSSLNLPVPFPDALQEFKVETSALPAQYGLHSAATVNSVTKSGTNSFHGDLFEFLRNGDFNARSFFATSRDSLKQNQWGGTVGGPILKNKLFFFAGYQQTDKRSNPVASKAFIPTAAALNNGDFSTLAGPSCNNGRTVSMPGGTQIPVSSFSPISLKIASLLPKTADPCGVYIYGNNSNSDQYDSVARVDYLISAKQTLFGRATTDRLNSPSTYDGTDPLTLATNATSNRVFTLALGDTYLVSPNMVNSFRVAAIRTQIARIPDSFFNFSDLGMGSNFTDVGGKKTVQFSVGPLGSGFGIGSVNGTPGNTATGPNPQIGDDINWIKGNHQIGIGFSYMFQLLNYFSGLNSTGIASFPGTGTGSTGLAMADFLTAASNGAFVFSQGNIYGMTTRQNYFAAYVQDSWKVARNFTVTYGVRYEPYFSIYSKYGQFMHFDMSQFLAGTKSQVFLKAPAGLTFPGDPSYNIGNSVDGNKLLKFAPRLGVVWDPKGDGKMTVRAAYGIFTDRQSAFSLTFIAQNQPFGNNIVTTNPTLANPWINQPGGNPFPLTVNANTPFQTNAPVVSRPLDNFNPTYLQQWNMSVQKQVGTSWLFTVNYLGNHTVHLLTSNQANPAVFLGTGPCNLNKIVAGQVTSSPQTVCSTVANQTQRRTLFLLNPLQGQYYAGVPTVDDGGTASYNALFFSAQKRLSQGLTVLANYTWSHCIGDIFDTQTGAGGASATAIPGNREAYRSNCGTSDVRQLFNLSAVATTPTFANRALKMVVTGWSLSPIIRIQSAQQFTVTSGVDTALSIQGGQTPNLVLANPYPAQQSITNWINRSAFATPAAGSYGNLGLNNMKGPGIWTVDASVVRTFRILERLSLQARAEAFNISNHVNFANPNANLNAPSTFGQITAVATGSNPRIIQFAAKILF